MISEMCDPKKRLAKGVVKEKEGLHDGRPTLRRIMINETYSHKERLAKGLAREKEGRGHGRPALRRTNDK